MSCSHCNGGRKHLADDSAIQPRGLPRRNILSIDEFIGAAVRDILRAYENVNTCHAESDMDNVLDGLKRDYRYLTWSQRYIEGRAAAPTTEATEDKHDT